MAKLSKGSLAVIYISDGFLLELLEIFSDLIFI